MKTNDTERKGCKRPAVVTFLGIAILIVVAFLIVGLVKTCQSDHESDENGNPEISYIA